MFLKLALLLSLALFVPQMVMGQTANNGTTLPIPNTPSTNGTDMATAITVPLVSSGLVGAFAYLKDKIDKKDVTKKLKGTDVDMSQFVALMSKFFQYSYVYKNYTIAQILDLPATNNAMDKTTLGMAISNEANEWVNFVQSEYNVPRPPMAIASQSIVTATQNNIAPPASQETKAAP